MKRNLLLLGIAVLVLGGMIGGLYVNQFTPDYYTGKETFMSQEEYTAFKFALAWPEVHVTEVAVLSSEPPILVTFKVRVPSNYAFCYGERTRAFSDAWLFLLLLIPIGIMVSALIPDEEVSQPS